MADWANSEVAGALEGVGVLVHCVEEFTASQFSDRLQLAVTMEAAHRLRAGLERKTENAN
jgi:hypothetical protein